MNYQLDHFQKKKHMLNISNKNVLVIEDIIDTGRTLKKIKDVYQNVV